MRREFAPALMRGPSTAFIEDECQEEYALALAPGFCRFYAHIGVIDALYDAKYLNVTHLTGCSAGALVSAFMATGMDPPQMAERVLAIQRSDIWDVGGIGGLLKGNLFLQKISENLSVKQFQDTKIPLAMTAFDLSRLKTNCIVTGDIAAATRASCTFPGLFQPISIDNRPHIDGGVWDHDGLMSLDACFREKHRRDQPHLSPHQLQALPLRDIVPSNKLIVNVTFDFLGFSKLPPGLEHCRLLSLVLRNVPGVTPFSMQDMGPRAMKIAKVATQLALHSAHMMELAVNHWCCYIDAKRVTEEMLEGSKLPMAPPLIRATSVDSSSSRPASEQCGSAVSSASGSRERSSVVDGTGHVVDGMIAIRRASSLASVSTVIYEAEDANGTLSSQVLEVEDSVLQDLLAHPDHLLALQQQQQQQQQQQRTEPGEGAEDELEERAILPSEDKSNRNSSQANQQEQQDQQEAGLCASSSPSSLPSSDAPNDSNDEDSAVVSNHVPFQDAFRTPSYSFINGTYYFYQAASETLASSSSFLRSLAGGGASGEEGLSRKRSASRSAVQQEEDERPTSEAVESSDVSKKTRLL